MCTDDQPITTEVKKETKCKNIIEIQNNSVNKRENKL